jgi:hypothetical protein
MFGVFIGEWCHRLESRKKMDAEALKLSDILTKIQSTHNNLTDTIVKNNDRLGALEIHVRGFKNGSVQNKPRSF